MQKSTCVSWSLLYKRSQGTRRRKRSVLVRLKCQLTSRNITLEVTIKYRLLLAVARYQWNRCRLIQLLVFLAPQRVEFVDRWDSCQVFLIKENNQHNESACSFHWQHLVFPKCWMCYFVQVWRLRSWYYPLTDWLTDWYTRYLSLVSRPRTCKIQAPMVHVDSVRL